MSFFNRLFGRKQTHDAAKVYSGLRAQAMKATPSLLGGDDANDEVFGVLVDIGLDGGSATVLAMADGSTSLYTSAGGGIIGGGSHEKVAESSKVLVSEAQRQRGLLVSDWKDSPLENGEVRFIALTTTGRLAARARAADLAAGNHVLSSLFVAANNVITQLRESSGGYPAVAR